MVLGDQKGEALHREPVVHRDIGEDANLWCSASTVSRFQDYARDGRSCEANGDVVLLMQLSAEDAAF